MTHSRFHIPLKIDQNSTAGIKHGTDIAELLHHTSLIIWDESSMQHRHAFECVDRSLHDIMSYVNPAREKKPFGGITVVFGGDFHQILPVIPKATRAEVVGATLIQSKLWDHCQVFILKQNMRLHSSNTPEHNKVIKEFSDWKLKVGDGKLSKASDSANRYGPTDTNGLSNLKGQFSLQLCFAMMVNKSQGQSLDTVGLYLPKLVFCHGQLYVAIARVTSPKGLYILIDSDSGQSTNITENIVFEEVFYNLPDIDD
ncbi:uncharacterized protein LOC141664958 [Apium graveolens]|uniref:uncharacterized protein LOC141664958 n=1 Tax=Apium graveolens TaxID=4045 RepID=UPI003D799E51